MSSRRTTNRSEKKRHGAVIGRFAARNKRLRVFGFSDYAEYISSSLWQSRRRAYYENHAKRCHVCRSKEDVVLHHCTYKRVCRERDEDLVPLCGRCHEIAHSWSRSFGRTLVNAMRKAYKRTGRPEVGLREKQLAARGGGRVTITFIESEETQ